MDHGSMHQLMTGMGGDMMGGGFSGFWAFMVVMMVVVGHARRSGRYPWRSGRDGIERCHSGW